MAKKIETERTQEGEPAVTEQPSGISDQAIYDQAQIVADKKSSLADIKRFAEGHGETKDEGEDDDEFGFDNEDFDMRQEFYKNWTSKDFMKLLDIVNAQASEKQQNKALRVERVQVAEESANQGREAKSKAQMEILLTELDSEKTSEMYNDLLDAYDEAFDSDAFIKKYGLDKDIYNNWGNEQWVALADKIDDLDFE